MIITTTRSRLGVLLDTLLTIIGWLGFLYLLGMGIVAILQGLVTGPDVPLWSAFLPTASTIMSYVIVAAVNAAILVAWALYNQWRFSGLNRRKARPVTRVGQLAQSFHLAPEQIRKIAGAKVAVVHHDDTERIVSISLADQR